MVRPFVETLKGAALFGACCTLPKMFIVGHPTARLAMAGDPRESGHESVDNLFPCPRGKPYT
ncbi:MAG: hypothetical protein ACLSIH_09460, partial [Eggerthella lenta]